MTGIINPDGTIGPVGGIPEKFAGSIEKGKKRIGYPIGMRMARSRRRPTSSSISSRSRRSSGAEAVEIADVHDAYKLLTGKVLPEPRAGRPRRRDGARRRARSRRSTRSTRSGSSASRPSGPRSSSSRARAACRRRSSTCATTRRSYGASGREAAQARPGRGRVRTHARRVGLRVEREPRPTTSSRRCRPASSTARSPRSRSSTSSTSRHADVFTKIGAIKPTDARRPPADDGGVPRGAARLGVQGVRGRRGRDDEAVPRSRSPATPTARARRRPSVRRQDRRAWSRRRCSTSARPSPRPRSRREQLEFESETDVNYMCSLPERAAAVDVVLSRRARPASTTSTRCSSSRSRRAAEHPEDDARACASRWPSPTTSSRSCRRSSATPRACSKSSRTTWGENSLAWGLLLARRQRARLLPLGRADREVLLARRQDERDRPRSPASSTRRRSSNMLAQRRAQRTRERTRRADRDRRDPGAGQARVPARDRRARRRPSPTSSTRSRSSGRRRRSRRPP